jgi:hypothetical protein
MNGLSPAEHARTAVASALTGALTAYLRQATPLRARVTVRDDRGQVVLGLSSDSDAARLLSIRPFAAVRVAPPGCEPTVLQGTVCRLARADRSRITRFTLTPGAIRLDGAQKLPVEASAYLEAQPDPLRHEAAAVIAHLRRDHGQDLADCLRAQGHHQVLWAEASRLDRYGLELIALEAEGISTIRLTFPEPVHDLRELGPSLYLALHDGCGECRHRRSRPGSR